MQKEKQSLQGATLVAVGIIVNEEGKLFLAEGKKFGNKYILPGGKSESGESLEMAIKREILEETNMEVEIEKPLFFSEIRNRKEKIYKGRHLLLCDFLLKYSGDGSEIELNEEYTENFGWFTPEEALKLHLEEGAKEIVQILKEYQEKEESLMGWKRCLADFENFKKRQENMGRDLAGRAVESFVGQILPVLDNLTSSLDHVPEKHKSDPWVVGLTYIHKQLEDILRDNGVEEIAVQSGDVFDPQVHEAIQSTENEKQTTDRVKEDQDGQEDGKKEGMRIEKVIQKGYLFQDRLIRPARVHVTQ
jgi:molecular chaperone GrpE (heat shock protein)